MKHFVIKKIFSRMLLLPFWTGRRLEQAARNLGFRLLADIHRRATLLPSARLHNLAGPNRAISIGAGSIIAGELLTFAHGGKIEIGEWCYIGEGTRIWSAEQVMIGDRVLISHNVNIHDTDSHPLDRGERHRHFVTIALEGHPRKISSIQAAPVAIGDDVWIGFNTIILKGVSIGAGSVIAAGSVITSDIPPMSLVVKNKIERKLD